MIKKVVIILIIILSASTNVLSLEHINIEIFDINKECVIKRIPSNSTIQQEAINYLKGITNVYCKFNPVPSKGYMIKIPLESPVMIQNQWLNAFVDQAVILFPEQEEPYLMVFDNEDKLLFFCFEGKTEVLLRNLNFQLKTY